MKIISVQCKKKKKKKKKKETTTTLKLSQMLKVVTKMKISNIQI